MTETGRAEDHMLVPDDETCGHLWETVCLNCRMPLGDWHGETCTLSPEKARGILLEVRKAELRWANACADALSALDNPARGQSAARYILESALKARRLVMDETHPYLSERLEAARAQFIHAYSADGSRSGLLPVFIGDYRQYRAYVSLHRDDWYRKPVFIVGPMSLGGYTPDNAIVVMTRDWRLYRERSAVDELENWLGSWGDQGGKVEYWDE